jgi:hypothetical protein
MGAGGEVVNQAAKAAGLPSAKFGDTYDNSTYFNDATSAVIGPEYQAQGLGEKTSKFAGGLVGPMGVLKGAKNAAGFIRAMGGSLDNFISDPKALKAAYEAWEKGLENIPVTPKQFQEGVVAPLYDKLKYQLPFMGRDGKEVVTNVAEAAPVVTNARYLEGLRKILSGDGSPAATVARRQADEFMSSEAIPVTGRDQYRRFKVLGEVEDALRNLGNETMKATRTKINNIDKVGLKAAERDALERAGRAGLSEGLLRSLPIGRGSSAVMGAGTSVAAGPVAGTLLYAGGRGLENVADRMAMKRIDDLRNVLMNGRNTPNMGEKAGAYVRDNIIKALQGK